MPEYKLTYFNGRGLGDVSRQLFALAGVAFEDVRYGIEDWGPEAKAKTPFGQMPVLETNGIQIPQSLAIARYLANKFGYAGKTAEEKALADALADQFKDFYVEIKPYYYGKLGMLGTPEEVEEHKTKTLVPARDKFLAILLKFLKSSKSGFLLDGGVTFADLIITDNMRTLIGWWPEYVKDYPEVRAWYDKVANIPAIKKHIETSPESQF